MSQLLLTGQGGLTWEMVQVHRLHILERLSYRSVGYQELELSLLHHVLGLLMFPLPNFFPVFFADSVSIQVTSPLSSIDPRISILVLTCSKGGSFEKPVPFSMPKTLQLLMMLHCETLPDEEMVKTTFL